MSVSGTHSYSWPFDGTRSLVWIVVAVLCSHSLSLAVRAQSTPTSVTSPTTTVYTWLSQSYYDCNFDDDFCTWKNESGTNFFWQRAKQIDPNLETGMCGQLEYNIFYIMCVAPLTIRRFWLRVIENFKDLLQITLVAQATLYLPIRRKRTSETTSFASSRRPSIRLPTSASSSTTMHTAPKCRRSMST